MNRIAPLALLLLTGCLVPKNKYLALEQQVVDRSVAYERVIADRESTIAEHEARVAELEAEVAVLDGQAQALTQQITEAQTRLSELEATNAEILSSRGRLKEEVAAMQEALRDLNARKAKADARVAQFKEMVAKFQKLIDAGTLQVKIIDGRMVVVLATDVLFASGSAALSDGGKAALTEVAGVLASLDRDFQVEGHTDDDPIASQQYPSNWYLASGRAIGVVEHLIANGLDPKRISAAAFGEFRPVASNESKEGKAQNRRIEIIVVPDLSGLPGYDELSNL